jgi:acyl-coenzyme A synthetase/AMP-(fatty) acid ligase
VKSAVFGTRRSERAGRDALSPLDAALAPALAEGSWRVPSRFNFTRDVVEVLAQDPRRQALTFLGSDGVIEPRTFLQLAQGAARWSAYLHEHGIGPGDRMLVVEAATPDWVEIMLAGIKLGVVTVPCARDLPAAALGIRIAAVGAKLVVASRTAEAELAGIDEPPPVLYVDDARREAYRLPKEAPTHDTSASDPAFIVSTSGKSNGPRLVLHTHGSTFAARAHTQHWLDAGLGDVVWCTAPANSAQALWSTLLGPWSRGAEIVLREGPLDPVEQLDLVYRLGVTVLCQAPAEYRVLTESGQLARFRSVRPRRLVSTGECLSADLIEAFEEQWGLTIQDGYGQAETGVITGHRDGVGVRSGSMGQPLPGFEVAVIDPAGNELPPRSEGDLALRGRPPSLFAGYWNAPDETEAAFRGDWYLTGDFGMRDDDGFLWFRGRTGDVLARTEDISDSFEIYEEPTLPVSPVEHTEVPVGAAAVALAQESSEWHLVERPEPAPAPAGEGGLADDDVLTRAAPLWARITATIWLLLVGVLVGGAAIPHANDTPRVVPPSEDVPNTICLPPSPRP